LWPKLIDGASLPAIADEGTISSGAKSYKVDEVKDPPVRPFAFTFGTAILGIVEKPHFDLVNYCDSLNHRNSPAPLSIDAAK
jgi:hypothetical protein